MGGVGPDEVGPDGAAARQQGQPDAGSASPMRATIDAAEPSRGRLQRSATRSAAPRSGSGATPGAPGSSRRRRRRRPRRGTPPAIDERRQQRRPAGHAPRSARETALPVTMPAPPPMTLSSTASTRNCSSTWMRRAPIAMRMPISRVRSVTETSRMFMMPMPPTTSEIEATDASSSAMTRLLSSAALVMSLRLLTLKSFGLARLDVVALRQRVGDLVQRGRHQLAGSRACTKMMWTKPVELRLEAERVRRRGVKIALRRWLAACARRGDAQDLELGGGERDQDRRRPGPGRSRTGPCAASTPITCMGTPLTRIVAPTGFWCSPNRFFSTVWPSRQTRGGVALVLVRHRPPGDHRPVADREVARRDALDAGAPVLVAVL